LHFADDLGLRFGRTRPLFLGYAIFLIWQIPFAVATNIETILISRFFAALFGSSTLAIVGGMMVDFLGPIERGISTGVYSVGVFCGPVLGPVFGTLINESLGWRWTGWLTLIFGAFLGAVCLMCTRESSPHTLRRRHARKLGLPCEEHQPEFRMFVEKYLTKPIRMLFCEPIVRSLHARYQMLERR
jgi:MFS family permease